VGTPAGLFVVDPVRAELVRSVAALRNRNVQALGFDQNRNLWVGTTEGLFQIRADSGELLGRVPLLPSSQILSVAPGVGNKVWVGTSEGLGWVSQLTGQGHPHRGLVSPQVLEAQR
jgi:ligand-binding sensor domain-containing protein